MREITLRLTEKQIDEVMKVVENTKNKMRKPQENEKYYYISELGTVALDEWKNFAYNKGQYNIGNCFKTREEAEFEIEKLKVITELRDFALENNDDNFDIYDFKWKYCIKYNIDKKTLRVGSEYGHVAQGAIFFSDQNVAEQAIETIGENRIKKYLFNVEE